MRCKLRVQEAHAECRAFRQLGALLQLPIDEFPPASVWRLGQEIIESHDSLPSVSKDVQLGTCDHRCCDMGIALDVHLGEFLGPSRKCFGSETLENVFLVIECNR